MVFFELIFVSIIFVFFGPIPCGTKFLCALIFAVFLAIHKYKFPQIKITNIFPLKFTPD